MVIKKHKHNGGPHRCVGDIFCDEVIYFDGEECSAEECMFSDKCKAKDSYTPIDEILTDDNGLLEFKKDLVELFLKHNKGLFGFDDGLHDASVDELKFHISGFDHDKEVSDREVLETFLEQQI